MSSICICLVRLGNSLAALEFQGFMVEVRKSETDLAMGRFVEFDSESTGLDCNSIPVRYYQPIIKSSLLNTNNVYVYRSYNYCSDYISIGLV